MVICVKKAILIFILTFCVFGCNKNRYANIKHYDLKNRDIKSMVYETISDKTKEKEIYIVTDISQEGSEMIKDGIFMKVKENDYIKIDEYESCNANAYSSEKYTYFSGNKLYISRCSGGKIYEYTLDGINTQRRDLTTKVNLYNARIYKIQNGYIYFEGEKGDFSGEIKYVKCSLESTICEVET